MKVNLVYHTPKNLGSGYMGSQGLKNALDKNGYLEYAFNSVPGEQELDVDKLISRPIYFVRGMLLSRMPIVMRTDQQFKACWQSESYYTRHGNKDGSTDLMVENQKHFQMLFVTAESDLELYDKPTYFLPSWADTTVLQPMGSPTIKHKIGFIGGIKGREDFFKKDTRGLIECAKTELYLRPERTAQALAEKMAIYDMLVSPPGRCFNGMCGRAFEIMACNRLCFQWLNEDTMFKHMKFFDDMKDIVYFHDMNELYEKYDYLVKHPYKVRQIAESGYEKVKKYHNQDARVDYIVESMRIEYVKWLKTQDNIPSWIDDIYESIGVN